jgi:hypothetical protein
VPQGPAFAPHALESKNKFLCNLTSRHTTPRVLAPWRPCVRPFLRRIEGNSTLTRLDYPASRSSLRGPCSYYLPSVPPRIMFRIQSRSASWFSSASLGVRRENLATAWFVAPLIGICGSPLRGLFALLQSEMATKSRSLAFIQFDLSIESDGLPASDCKNCCPSYSQPCDILCRD